MSAVAYPLETKISLSRMRIGVAVVTAVVFVVGFIDLWRGGITVSAFALAIGYCALIPALIWLGGDESTRRGRSAASSEESVPYLAAGIAALCVLVLYVVTMAPSTAMWDTSEYIAAA